jgi:hypothetical protein
MKMKSETRSTTITPTISRYNCEPQTLKEGYQQQNIIDVNSNGREGIGRG